MTAIALFLLAGCQSSAPPPAVAAGTQTFTSAQLLRRLNFAGLTKNDEMTVTSPAEIATLQGYFPDLGTKHTSTMNGTWVPWIIIRFHLSDGTETYVSSDYRIYRIDDGGSGDFVVNPGFADHVEQLMANLPPQ
jgi:hypothetical protein